ncbi:MAG TPA: acyl-CoA-binding protein [Kofleriaceae bacterium]|nr:acyl-CoA-binding protein [Kofleriaceae bacterium]
MSLADDFQAAVERVNQLAAAPPTDVQLELYGLFKQATAGDVTGSRPGMLDVRGRAKYDAWASRKGMSRDDAMRAYIEAASRAG